MSPTDAVYSGATERRSPVAREEKINANPFSLYHMIGNVREWTADGWSPTLAGVEANGAAAVGVAGQQTARGGSYKDVARVLRFSKREGIATDTRDEVTGFRVLREF